MITFLDQSKSSFSIKIGVQLFLIILTLPFVGQGQNFNRKYNFSPNSVSARALEYLSADSIFMISFNFYPGYIGINSTIINDTGGVQINKSFMDSTAQLYSGWANISSQSKTRELIMAGGYGDTSNFGYLVKFNRLGDTLWTRTFGDTTNWYTFRQAIATADGGYAAVGEYAAVGQRSDGWLVKTDSLGNLQWQKFYSISLGTFEALTSVQQCSDGGFILGGWEKEFPNQNTRNNDPIVIKTDSLGNQAWRHKYNTISNDAVAYAIQTQDGNFVFGSSKSIFERIPHASVPLSKALLVKLDVNGNVLWEKEYGHIGRNHSIQVVKELPNGNLIACGRRRQLGTTAIKGLLMKTTANGDSIWIHDYEFDATQSRSLNYLWDVIQMPDGGFVAAGETSGGTGLSAYQDTWLIRVDSNGCIQSNCTVGAESLKPKAGSLRLYPNPTNGIVNVKSDELIESIRIFDVQGQLVKVVLTVQNQFELPKENGLYFIRIGLEDGRVLTEKVIRN